MIWPGICGMGQNPTMPWLCCLTALPLPGSQIDPPNPKYGPTHMKLRGEREDGGGVALHRTETGLVIGIFNSSEYHSKLDPITRSGS